MLVDLRLTSALLTPYRRSSGTTPSDSTFSLWIYLYSKFGGPSETRTRHLLLARQALSQMSYGPRLKAYLRKPNRKRKISFPTLIRSTPLYILILLFLYWISKFPNGRAACSFFTHKMRVAEVYWLSICLLIRFGDHAGNRTPIS